MAASDKPFRSQRSLDIVFAVSNILMLITTIWMLWADYAREYKTEGRIFRDLEVSMAQQQALQLVPSKAEFDAAKDEVEKFSKIRNSDANKEKLANAKAAMLDLKPKKERAEANYQSVKAELDSKNSLRNIAREQHDSALAEHYNGILVELNKKLAEEQAVRDETTNQMKLEQLRIDEVEGKLTKAIAEFKKVNDRFDSQVKLALNKRWTWGDWFRTQPVINGFADPLKIHQFTINDIPIDYNFKLVTRFDRCMSCHVGIDRPSFTKANLEALTKEGAFEKPLQRAKDLYKTRTEELEKAGVSAKEIAMIPNPNELSVRPISKDQLTKARISEFAGHPRLDLYVGSNSKHPAEKFGCSSCHYGQGSGTSFLDSAHTPNNSKTREEWAHERGWAHDHNWDFPMLPTRFIESSCLKCHHEVTDLISSDNRVEAPKVVRGFNLIKENGCFGCHEINGWKGGQRVGPDLRLEPNPALEDLNPIERTRVEFDPDNRPGSMRKVGPALSRIIEKVDTAWIEKWLYSPSNFRPDTKMPHYFNLSTNSKDYLEKEAPSQKEFPNTEIASIAHFLTATSNGYLQKAEKLRQADAEDRKANKDPNHHDQLLLIDLLNRGRLSEKDRETFDEVKMRIKLRNEIKLVDLAPKHKGDKDKGRILFTERGCLACHTHQGTEKADQKIPEVKSDAVFGPNLSQLKDKLKSDKADARKWLIQWIVNPQVHSPRSRMPVTHLSHEEAADVAAWLLAQDATDAVGPKWAATTIDAPTREQLKELARVYLKRMLSKSEMDRFFKGISREDAEKLRQRRPISDEAVTLMVNDLADDEKNLLIEDVTNDDSLKFYLGKKAVSRLGCYGCHDIPGFENAKSIGVGLNDWGKKAPERLAFEDIGNFFSKEYYKVDSLVDDKGKPHGLDKDGKKPYEKFYADLLLGHGPQREGYLNQKIRDPRSYDFNRTLAWDDRARMPEFHFARPRKQKEEADGLFAARKFKDEAEVRESVATFVLGLTAEAVPAKSTNQPVSDRLAEVKGRQILDKYNCYGCHLVRPGVYDFRPGPKTLAKLNFAADNQQALMKTTGEINVPNHVNWVGRNPLGLERLTTYGVNPTFLETVNRETEEKEPWMVLRLSEALRFLDDKKVVRNIPSSTPVLLALEDLHPNPASIHSDDDIDWYFGSVKPYGGAFSTLLVPYLNKRDPVKYAITDGDSKTARASLPPTLIGQGERTQADWLYQFLLNPTKVRKLPILRMPKFNMSKEEAKTLVDYFASITRQTNPGVGLAFPFEAIPQQDTLDSDYWTAKTKDYVARLRKTPATDADGKVIKGKDGTDMFAYEQRVAEYAPFWEKISKEQEASIKAELQKLDDLSKARTAQIEDKKKALKADKAKGADLQKEIDSLTQLIKDADADKAQLEASLKTLDVKTLQKNWEEKDAYAADAYRMLTSRKLCAQCHQIGNIAPSDKDTQGPPLAQAHARLRPHWIVNWVNRPERFLPYTSLMPMYFNEKDAKWQNIHTGAALEQIQALRDVLMNYPRIAEMPVNRLYSPDLPADKK